jgi:hypothetical protein
LRYGSRNIKLSTFISHQNNFTNGKYTVTVLKIGFGQKITYSNGITDQCTIIPGHLMLKNKIGFNTIFDQSASSPKANL